MSGPSSNAPSGPMEIPNFTIPEGSGWSKSPRKLARHGYFARGEGICKLLEDHGYGYIYPVMMDEYNTYLIRGMTRERKLIYFVWNPIADTIFKAVKTDVQEIVGIMVRSVLALDVVDLKSVAGTEAGIGEFKDEDVVPKDKDIEPGDGGDGSKGKVVPKRRPGPGSIREIPGGLKT